MQKTNWFKVFLFVALIVSISVPAMLLFSESTVYNPLGLGGSLDLVTPTSTQNYPLGFEVVIKSSQALANKYMYIKSSAAAVPINQLVLIDLSSTAGAELITATPATAAVDRLWGVTPAAFAASYYGFVQTQGYVTVKTTGIVNAGEYFMPQDGVSFVYNELSVSVYTIGAYIHATAAAALVKGVLFGREAQSN